MGSSPQLAPTRTVVLLRPADRRKLEKLAAAEKVSSGEILRRSLSSYEGAHDVSEDELLAALFGQMNSALGEALASLKAARVEIRSNLRKIEKMKASGV